MCRNSPICIPHRFAFQGHSVLHGYLYYCSACRPQYTRHCTKRGPLAPLGSQPKSAVLNLFRLQPHATPFHSLIYDSTFLSALSEHLHLLTTCGTLKRISWIPKVSGYPADYHWSKHKTTADRSSMRDHRGSAVWL